MKKQLVLFNNNLVNKYDFSFSIKSLSTQLLGHYDWELGIPNFINHDMHRPFSWSRIHGLSIDNTKIGLFGEISIPETKIEKRLVHNLTQIYLRKTVFNITHEDKDKLKTLIGESVYSENIKFIRGECITAFDTNIALKKFPELFGDYENDKRSLVDLSTLDCIAPGVFLYNDLLVFAHRYFRRSLSPLNNLNTPLLKQLQTLSSNKDLDVKILLDPHSLGLPGSYLEPVELDYWWGPKFDDSLKDISNGVSTHATSKDESFFNGISKTEFWWHEQNGIKSLECEETRDIPSAEMLELGTGRNMTPLVGPNSTTRPINQHQVVSEGIGQLFRLPLAGKRQQKWWQNLRSSRFLKALFDTGVVALLWPVGQRSSYRIEVNIRHTGQQG